MTKLGRPGFIRLLALATMLLFLPATSWGEERPAIAVQIANTYGLASFGKIDAIRFTFNAELPGLNLSRSWVYQPKTGQVSYEGKDKEGKPVKASYIRTQLDGQPANVRDEIDPAFLNDEYNLLFPLHVYWDANADVKDQGLQKLPLGKGSAKKVAVKYPAEGYSPGDTWDLFLGPDGRVKEFAFHRGGDRKPGEVATAWGAYKKAGPLLVATDRRGTADGKPLHVWMTDVAIKLAGSDAWVNAK